MVTVAGMLSILRSQILMMSISARHPLAHMTDIVAVGQSTTCLTTVNTMLRRRPTKPIMKLPLACYSVLLHPYWKRCGKIALAVSVPIVSFRSSTDWGLQNLLTGEHTVRIQRRRNTMLWLTSPWLRYWTKVRLLWDSLTRSDKDFRRYWCGLQFNGWNSVADLEVFLIVDIGEGGLSRFPWQTI